MRIHRRLNLAKFFAVIGLFAGALGIFVGAVAAPRDRVRVEFGAEYYFLVRDCTEAAAVAVAGQVYSAGGAGVIWDGAVAVACYFAERDALRARTSLEEQDVKARVKKRSCPRFYVRGREKAERAYAALGAADACARILFHAANALERAEMGQTGARESLLSVKDTLRGLREALRDTAFLRLNAVLHEAEREAEEAAEGLVFARDLRRLQVRLCDLVVCAADYL